MVDVGKSAKIAEVIGRRNVNVVALQEVRYKVREQRN